MRANRFANKLSPHGPAMDRKRRRREILLILVILGLVALLTTLEVRVIRFGSEFPISNTILMFILININLLLLILLIFLVFRNLVKLLYDRRRRIMGAGLRTRLVVAFVSITLMPTVVLFFFSIHFITSSIEFWFNVPVEQALENSLSVGGRLYQYFEDHNRFFLKRIAYQVRTRNLLDPSKREELDHYVDVAQRAFNLEAVEVYDTRRVSDRKSNRLSSAFKDLFGEHGLRGVSPHDLRGELNASGVRSFSDPIPIGELARTISRIPYGAALEETRGFVVLSFLIPTALSEDLASISRGYEEYQQIKLLKEPIQLTYYITISIVALLVLFCAVWFGFHLAKTISIPIKDLADGTRRVAEGDLQFTIARGGDDEIGSLVDSFNKMTRDLRTSREQLELSAQMLREQNVEIEERRRYMEIVLEHISTGVITLDARGAVVTVNKSAERMLNLPEEQLLGRSYEALLGGQHGDLARQVREDLSRSREGAVEFPLRLTIGGAPRIFRIHVNALRDESGRHMGIVMVFDDLTELEKAQRMAAWREVARRVAHEVKNPLTPIKLSAQRLSRKYAERLNEPVFEECTRMIIDHVDLIRNLVNEFSAFARFPTPDPGPCELADLVEETVALYREGHPTITFRVEAPESLPTLHLDRQQIKQALINLVNNAVGAVRTGGTVAIRLRAEPEEGVVRLEVADDGPGIGDEDKARLFEPYFSTKKSGMGLGLTIVSSIVADHHGKIRVRDNTPHGAMFIIELPV